MPRSCSSEYIQGQPGIGINLLSGSVSSVLLWIEAHAIDIKLIHAADSELPLVTADPMRCKLEAVAQSTMSRVEPSRE